MTPLPPDWQNTFAAYNAALTRRQFFRRTGTGLGVAALAALMGERALGAGVGVGGSAPRAPWQIAPKAKRAIYISLIGAPRSRWHRTRSTAALLTRRS